MHCEELELENKRLKQQLEKTTHELRNEQQRNEKERSKLEKTRAHGRRLQKVPENYDEILLFINSRGEDCPIDKLKKILDMFHGGEFIDVTLEIYTTKSKIC